MTPTNEAKEVCRQLKNHHNAIVTGPPGTGKSRLVSEVKHWFSSEKVDAAAYNPKKGENPFPKDMVQKETDFIPAHDKKNRKVWDITFHQGTKYKDFVRGISPKLDGGFQITSGPFYEALQHALKPDSASLLIIDEFNRGPAVAIFGDLLAAMESDKRLAPDGNPTLKSLSVYTLNDEGINEAIFIPNDLYILACMNEADTSVEPLDIAFKRRFQVIRLLPSPEVLKNYFSIETIPETLPEAPTEATHIYSALINCWNVLNDNISWTKGDEFMIGHGVLMFAPKVALPNDIEGSLLYVSDCWNKIISYLNEIYFGETEILANVLNAGSPNNPYKLKERFFGDGHSYKLDQEYKIDPTTIYSFLNTFQLEQ